MTTLSGSIERRIERLRDIRTRVRTALVEGCDSPLAVLMAIDDLVTDDLLDVGDIQRVGMGQLHAVGLLGAQLREQTEKLRERDNLVTSLEAQLRGNFAGWTAHRQVKDICPTFAGPVPSILVTYTARGSSYEWAHYLVIEEFGESAPVAIPLRMSLVHGGGPDALRTYESRDQGMRVDLGRLTTATYATAEALGIPIGVRYLDKSPVEIWRPTPLIGRAELKAALGYREAEAVEVEHPVVEWMGLDVGDIVWVEQGTWTFIGARVPARTHLKVTSLDFTLTDRSRDSPVQLSLVDEELPVFFTKPSDMRLVWPDEVVFHLVSKATVSKAPVEVP